MRFSHGITTNGPSGLALHAGYPNAVAFMYSPQVVLLTQASSRPQLPVTVTVTHTATGKSHSETRTFHDGRVFFDLSRTMQLLAPDADTLLSRVDYVTGQSLAEAFGIEVAYTDTDGQSYVILTAEVLGLYGALDQNETYGEPVQRRLWLNYPQTFQLWRDSSDEVRVSTSAEDLYPAVAEGGSCYEVDIKTVLDTGSLRSGVPLMDVDLSWRYAIDAGNADAQDSREVVLIPDGCTEGTYLRWLNRQGGVSYWLFRNSQTRVTSAARSTFARHYDADPAVTQDRSYINPLKTDYREARELVIGAVGLTMDEYEDLCSLATSPVVEMLVDGKAPYKWQRVNVAEGTYARDIRRQTPSLQDLEFIIELPERNTAAL